MKVNYYRRFWPKKMKELVDEFEREGTINRQALIYVGNLAEKHAWILATFAFVFAVFAQWYLALLFIVLIPVEMKVSLSRCFSQKMLPYSVGVKREVRFVKADLNHLGKQGILYEELDGSSRGVISIEGWRPRVKKEDFPMDGGKMYIYQDAERKYQAMPECSYLQDVFSLKIVK